MTSKEYVLKLKPNCRAEKQIQGKIKGLQSAYYLIREKGNSMYLSEGKTEAQAWKNAKEILTQREL